MFREAGSPNLIFVYAKLPIHFETDYLIATYLIAVADFLVSFALFVLTAFINSALFTLID